MSSITTPSPEFSIEESDVRHVISILSVTFILATVTVPLRFIARQKLKTPFFLDDWLILGASILAAVPVWVYVESAYKQELGRQVEFNGPAAQINFRKKQYSCELVSVLAIVFTKLSILAFYWRVFSSQMMQVLIRITAGVVICGSTGFFMTSAIQCNPIHKVWDTVIGGTCINTNAFHLANAAFNIITDFSLLVLPLHVIWKLQISQSKKVMVSCLLTLGGLIISVVSVLRLCSLVHLNLRSDDVTWEVVYPTIWSIGEIQLGVLCACLPFLRPLFTANTQKVQGDVFSRRQTRRCNTQSQELVERDENFEEPKGEVVTHVWAGTDQTVEENWPDEWRQEIRVTRVLEWSAEEPANSLDRSSTAILGV
ncbi:hypothetical protein B0O99DRAFT_393870 [Bisporella sp. PMI_857]|nr:hypothetical protein B0O99DRAFT_393870 [Bisporella sp. PMI_857]